MPERQLPPAALDPDAPSPRLGQPTLRDLDRHIADLTAERDGAFDRIVDLEEEATDARTEHGKLANHLANQNARLRELVADLAEARKRITSLEIQDDATNGLAIRIAEDREALLALLWSRGEPSVCTECDQASCGCVGVIRWPTALSLPADTVREA